MPAAGADAGRPGGGGVNPAESVRSAWLALRANRLRTFLAALGVMIGVASVIALVSLGQGTTARVTAQVSGLGANLITVLPVRGTQLALEDAALLRERVPTVARAVPSVSAAVSVKVETDTWETTMEGVTEDLPLVRNYQVMAGRFLVADDVAARRKVAVIGQEVLRRLGGSLAPGTTLTVNGQPFLLVGVLAPKGSTFGRNEDDVIFVPVTTAQRLLGTTALNAIYLSARTAGESGLATAHALAVLRTRYPRPDGQDPVRILSQEQVLSTVGEVSRTMTLFLGAVAGISLVVGGIGIMNIMLVSVAERTREIGIRMAVGARARDILAQFLVESVLLSLTGGAVGVGAGVLAARWLGAALGAQAVLSPLAVLVALGFALAVGLIFGVYPAWRASRLDPVVALRRE